MGMGRKRRKGEAKSMLGMRPTCISVEGEQGGGRRFGGGGGGSGEEWEGEGKGR